MSEKQPPRVVDGRGHDFFIVDNPVIDQKIEQIDAKRRADAGWTYTVLCRLASNETGEATLKLSYLEKKTGRSKPVLIQALAALKQVGLIGVRKNRQDGRQGASTYVILAVPRVKDDNPEPDSRVNTDDPDRVNSVNRNTKTVSSTKTAVDVSDETSSGIEDESPDSANVIGLEKHLVDKLYGAMDRAGYTLDNSDFGYHLGRAKKMLEKMSPTDEEIESLPTSCVLEFEIKGRTDAMSGLRYMRQQLARRKRLESVDNSPSYYEQQTSSVDKARSLSWYASFYDIDYPTVERWLREGAGHSEIERRLQTGEVA